jgi:hypothetical protein
VPAGDQERSLTSGGEWQGAKGGARLAQSPRALGQRLGDDLSDAVSAQAPIVSELQRLRAQVRIDAHRIAAGATWIDERLDAPVASVTE